MAEIKLCAPIAEIRGQLGKGSDVYFIQRNGKTFMCHRHKEANGYPVRKTPDNSVVREPSKAQVSKQERFAEVHKMVAEVMATTTLREQYEREWAKQKKYATLRGYIFHRLYSND